MPTTFTIDPVTRIEGHLEIQVTVDLVSGQQKVVDARSAGTMFRGFEMILPGRDPRDAALYTQRICGVCPVPHALASCLTLDQAFGVTPPDNGRILRNLVLGANFLDSHLLHFYHLSALDFINTTGLLDMPPWMPRYVTGDMIAGPTAAALVDHYRVALAIRRKAHQMGAIFCGKLPCIASFVVGGCTEQVTGKKIQDFRALLTEIRAFIDNYYLPDAAALAAAFPSYYSLGVGPGNLLAYGVFDLNASGTSKLLGPGRYTEGVPGTVSASQITEDITNGWYNGADDLNPAVGVTQPNPDKIGAYTWLKAPRYASKPHELGPLARMWVNGRYTHGISAMDRIQARAAEAKFIADSMDGWLDQLMPGHPSYAPSTIPASATSAGLTEAPRGGLGHWMDVTNHVISRYQVITPTSWNAAPKDHQNQRGPIEGALINVPVPDISQPVEVLRVVHSFDPCLACAVHLVRPGQKAGTIVRLSGQP
jgi:hydrogenase large subunit